MISAFAVDKSGIIAHKMDFVSDGGDFLYLRKGEDVGAIEVAVYAAQLIQSASLIGWHLTPEAVEIAAIFGKLTAGAVGSLVALNKSWKFGLDQIDQFFENLQRTKELYRRLKDNLDLGSKPVPQEESSPIPKDLRIICTPDDDNEQAIPVFRALGARIRHRPTTADKGSHRFYVNDQRFAFFYRTPEERFLGLMGTEPSMQANLKADFLREWDLYPPDIVD